MPTMQQAASGMPYDLTVTGQPVPVSPSRMANAVNDGGQPQMPGAVVVDPVAAPPARRTADDWAASMGWGWGGGKSQIDPSNPSGDYYDDVSGGMRTGTSPFSLDYRRLPGYEAFYTPANATPGGDADPTAERFDLAGYLSANPGYSAWHGNFGGRTGTANWIQDRDGGLVGDPLHIRNTALSDARNIALVVAGGYLGGSYAFGGAGSAPVGAGATTTAGGGGAATTTGAAGGGASGTTAATGATNAALAESAVGTGGYGASSAGAGGGSTAAWGSGAGYTADAASTGGYWNGTDFSGSAPQAGGSNLGTTQAGSTSMGAGDWIQLAGLAGSLWQADQAGDRADSALAGAEAAAQGQLALSRDAFDWYRNTYESERGLREAAANRQNAVSDALLEGMTFANDQARELDQYNRTTFRPLEERLVSEAQEYDTPGRRMQAAASAAADVDMSAAAARDASNRELQRSGIAPGSARALALQADADIRGAATRGGAMTNAVRGVEQQGFARMADAANLGRGIATTQATQQQIATTAGQGSSNAAGAALNSGTSGTPTMTTGYQTAMNGMNSAGNLYSSIARTGLAQDEMYMQGLQGLGQWAGSRYGTSDPKVKKGTGKMANAAKALREVEKTPVHEGWEYDESKGAPPGSGGKKMIGPMATDVRRVSGEDSAPGGQVIDLVKAQGRMTAAVQELARRVKALEKAERSDEIEEIAA